VTVHINWEHLLLVSRTWKRYRVVPGHRYWQTETAGWNWAGFFTEGLETGGSDLGSFLMIYRNSSLEFSRFLHCGVRNPLAAIWAVSE